jgi:2-polyprenyl-3-methyl-5-hydroxy-6-metoxy-1,4-benzoquinol methylase
MNWLSPPRSAHKELLDAPEVLAHDLQENLDDLRRVNFFLGSRWLVLSTLRRLWYAAGAPAHWRVLDIGTGAGDIPAALARWGQGHGIQSTIVAIDQQWQVARYARAALLPPSAVLQANGLCLPFQPRSFDVVVCSHVLHHLDWQEGITLLRAMATVARHGVVVNDLVRSWLSYCGARMLLPLLSRNRLTLHDGLLSVLRAYRVKEVRGMAQAAGLTSAQVRSVLTYRLLLVYVPPDSKERTA